MCLRLSNVIKIFLFTRLSASRKLLFDFSLTNILIYNFPYCATQNIVLTLGNSLCAIFTLTRGHTPLMLTLTIAAWTQAVMESGYLREVQLGLGKGRQESIV